MRCPSCRTLTLVPAGMAGDAGSLVRCPRCDAAWVSRPGEVATAAAPPRAPMVRRPPLTIEAEAIPEGRRRLRRFGAGLVAVMAVLAVALAAVTTLAPGVSAGPETARAEGAR